jgi:endonuclease III
MSPDPELIDALFTLFEADKPEPLTELEFIDPFTLIVAVAMSAQTTDKAHYGYDLVYRPLPQ